MKENKIQKILIKALLDATLNEMYYNGEANIFGIYAYGSLLYNNLNEKSDLDYCIVVGEHTISDEYIQIELEDLDFHLMTEKHYKKLLKEHDIMALEMYYQKNPILKFEVDFTLDKVQLRNSISKVVSNSYVKAKKKMELPNEDSYIGLKSLFHSFRILDFGIQIAKNGEISNFNYELTFENITPEQSANSASLEWKNWKFTKPYLNAMKTEFRLLAPLLQKD